MASTTAEARNRPVLRDEDALQSLLRRCHRAELEPLARAIGLNPAGMPLDRIASALARSLRRAGANGLFNLLFRFGEGPTWGHVLTDLARRLGVQPGGSDEATELAIQRWAAENRWAGLSPAQRAAEWARLGLDLPPPGPEGLAAAEASLGVRFGYTAAQLVGVGALRLATLTPMGLILWTLARPDDKRLLAAVLEVARLRQAVQHRVTIGMVGSPSSGKDAGLKAIFGIDTGNVHPVAGSTREVQITKLQGAAPIFVVNTPGLGDVVEAVTEEARQILGLIDIYVYVVSAQGGVQQRELEDHDRCRASGRPVLVVLNKVDTLKAEDIARLRAHTAERLGRDVAEVLPVAFDPLPQLAEAPIGIEAVQAWLRDALTGMGKPVEDLPWA